MPPTHPVHSPEDTSRFVLTPVQTVTRLLGVFFVVIGTLGVASHSVGIDHPGHLNASLSSELVLAGVGIGGIVLDRTASTARRYLTAVGIGLFTWSLYGVLDGEFGSATVSIIGWVRLGVAVAVPILGLAMGRSRTDQRLR